MQQYFLLPSFFLIFLCSAHADTITEKVEYDRYGRLVKSEQFGRSSSSGTHAGDVSEVVSKYDTSTTKTVKNERSGLFKNTQIVSAPHCETYITETYLHKSSSNGGLKWHSKAIVKKIKPVGENSVEVIDSITTFTYVRQSSGAVTITQKSGIGTISTVGENQVFSVTSGTETVSRTNDQGYIIFTESKDISSGAVLSSWTAGAATTPWGQPLGGTSLNGLSTSATYDPSTRLMMSYKDALKTVTTYARNSLRGQVTQITRAGVITLVDISDPLVNNITVTGTDLSPRQSITDLDKLGRGIKSCSTIAGFGSATHTTTLLDNLGSTKQEQFGRHLTSTVNKDSGELETPGKFDESAGNVVPVANDIEYKFVDGYFVTSSNTKTASNPAEIITKTDCYGRVREIEEPGPDSKVGESLSDRVDTKHTTTYTYTFQGNGKSTVKVTTSGGEVRLTITDLHKNDENNARVSETRSGIDFAAEGAQGDGDLTFGENSKDLFSTNRTVIKKTTSGSAEIETKNISNAGNYTATKVDTKTETQVVDLNGEETITTTTDYTNKKVTTLSSVNGLSEVELDHNWLATKSTSTARGEASAVSTITRRVDGSVTNNSTVVGGSANFSNSFNQIGFQVGNITSPYRNIQILENTYLTHPDLGAGTRCLKINDGTGEQELLSNANGLESKSKGVNQINRTHKLAINSSGYETTLTPNEGDGEETTYTANASGVATKKTYADASKSTTTYKPDGTIKEITTAKGDSITYTWSEDTLKQLRTIVFPGVPDSTPEDNVPGTTVNLTHRASDGKIDTLEDNSGKRKFGYAKDRKIREEYISGALAGYTIKKTYDINGIYTGCEVLHGGQSLNNTILTYTDTGGKSYQIKEVKSNGESASFAYTAGLQQLTKITRGSLTQEYIRDNTGGRLIEAKTNQAGIASFGYTQFDARSRRTKVFTEGHSWDYAYDTNGNLISAKHPTLGDFYYGYDPMGRRISYGNANGQVVVNNNENLNQVSSYQRERKYRLYIFAHPQAELTLNGFFLPNNAGAFTHEATATGIEDTTNYIPYLVRGVLAGAGQEGAHSDAVSIQSGFAYVPSGTEVIEYDYEGNRKSCSHWDYIYDSRNNLRRLRTKDYTGGDTNNGKPGMQVSFDYTADGQRYKKHVIAYVQKDNDQIIKEEHTTWFLYDGWSLCYERREAGNPQAPNSVAAIYERFYTWGLDSNGTRGGLGGVGGLLHYREKIGDNVETYYPSYDGSGHVVALTRKSDNKVVAKYTYAPFGELITAEGEKAQSNPWRYATKYQDQETDFYYFGYRFYEPESGTWLSREPLGEAESINLYSYCHNDPVNCVDKLGLELYAFDGTGNNKATSSWDLSDDFNAPSNIEIIHELYVGKAHYMHGVGTGEDGFWATQKGEKFGKGMEKRLDDMMKLFEKDLAKNPNMKIDIIGFSRGAAAARAFSNRIIKKHGVKVRFLGIFDTVAQMGAPDKHNKNGLDLSIHENVEYTSHAVARNEYRGLFPLTSITNHYKQRPIPRIIMPVTGVAGNHIDLNAYNPNEIKSIQGINFSERGFKGAHSDVGGAYKDYRNMMALSWMLMEAKRQGVKLKPLKEYTHFQKLKDIPRKDDPMGIRADKNKHFPGIGHDSRIVGLDQWQGDRVIYPSNLDTRVLGWILEGDKHFKKTNYGSALSYYLKAHSTNGSKAVNDRINKILEQRK